MGEFCFSLCYIGHRHRHGCSKDVRLNCSDGSLAAFIWGDMPQDMRSSLERNIRNALLVESGPSLVYTDSSEASSGVKFPAIHFDVYMRNGPRVRSWLTVITQLLIHWNREMVRPMMCTHICYVAKGAQRPITINSCHASLRNSRNMRVNIQTFAILLRIFFCG